jgi:AraC-like DNA-binding protein
MPRLRRYSVVCFRVTRQLLPSHDKDLSLRDTDLPIRTSVLAGLPTLINELGGAGYEFLSAYGVDEQSVSRSDAFMSLRLAERMLEDAARQLGVPDFGLRLASQQDPHVLGPLAIAMENSSTVGEVLECASRFLFVVSPALSHNVVPDPLGSPGVMGIRYASTTGLASPQGIDYGLGMVHRVLTLVSGGGPYGLRSVQLPHPRLAPGAAYRQFFRADVAFNCGHAVLRVPRQLMAASVSGGNDVLRDIAVDFLETHFGRSDVPVSELVAVILEGQMSPERPDLTKVARLLSLHPRSLQRLLADEGVGFKDILDRVRRDQALNLLTSTELPLSQIAVQLGLGEQSSLTRAVRRWFGTTPSNLRKQADPGAAD